MTQMVQQHNDLSDAFQNQVQLMTSFAGTVDHRLKDVVNGIANNHLLIAEMVKKWDRSYSIIDKVLSTTTSMLILEIRAYTKVHMRIQKLSQGVNGLLTYKLSPNLIDPKTLNYTLYTISATLTQKFPQFHIATFDHHYYYYKTKNIIFVHNGNNLFVTLSISITSGSKLFNVYQIISLPAPLDQSTNHATQLTNFPPFFAIDQSRNTFIEINTIQKETHVGDHKWHCPQFLPQKVVSDVSCISAIFAQNTQVVPQVCDFTFIASGLRVTSMELANGQIIISNVEQIQLACPNDEIKVEKGCKLCFMKIPCLCSIHAGSFFFSQISELSKWFIYFKGLSS